MGLHELDPPDEPLEFTGERYTPDVGDQIQHEHLHRYLFALRWCAGRRVVDVACGEGYGASLLGTVAEHVVGVDSSAGTIEHATRAYGSGNVVFHAADAASVPVEDGWADVVVSFETIEHLDDQPAFLAEVTRILRPDGLLVLSTPDRSVYLAGGEPNPFHVHELDRAELEARLGERFARFVVGGQRSDRGSSIAFPASAGPPGEASFFDRAGEGSFRSSDDLPTPPYLIALATNGELPGVGPSTFLDPDYLPQLHAAYHRALDEAWAEVAARDERLEDLESDLGNEREQLRGANATIESLQAAIASLNEALQHVADERWTPPEQPAEEVESRLASSSRLIRFADDEGLPPEVGDAAIVARAAAWTGSHASARAAERLAYRPVVSILLPVFDTPPGLLAAVVRSVLAQSYGEWELVIVDDASTAPFEPPLAEIAGWDDRIHVTRRGSNGGIAEATNTALELAEGEFVAMLDHDDELHPDALFEVVRALNADPALDVVYTDQEYVEADGSPGEPLLKPDWSPTLFCGVMYVGHLLTVRRELARSVGGFDARFDNVQDFEFMLRLSERTARIAHVPSVLYRWRRVPGSVAYAGDEKAGIEALQSAAVTAHLERLGVPARARPHPRHAHRAELVPLDGAEPSVEVVVPRPGSSLREATAGLAAEFVLVVADGVEPESDDWLAHLALHAAMDGVGAVAPLVLGPSGPQVEDAGLIVGAGGDLVPAMRRWDSRDDGYAGSLSCAREVSAVSGLCALIATETLERLGGFSDLLADPALAWVDLSLRARSEGLRNVVTPRAVVRRTAAARPPDPLDLWLLRDTWADALAGGDPYHNPRFRAAGGGYGL